MQREWAKLYGIPLMEEIKNKFPDCEIDTIAYKISTFNYVKTRKDLFNKIWHGYKYDDKINDKKIKEKINKISVEYIEKELNIDSIWKNIIYVDRNLVFTPGKKNRYSYRQQVSDEDAISIAKLNFLLIKNEIFSENQPDLVILPNFGSIFHNILFHYCKSKKIECWIPQQSKISNRMILINNIDYSFDNIFKNYEKYIPKKESIEFSKKYINDNRKEIIKPVHFRKSNKNLTFNFNNQYFKFAFGIIKLPIKLVIKFCLNLNKLNPKVYRTLDNIKVSDILFTFFKSNFTIIRLNLFKYNDLNKIEKYAYFPLHVQPEVSTNLWAPIFSNQFDLIRQIAISLPLGLTLVVKEHPIMIGKRPINFYKKLKKLPNVKLIDYRIDTNKIINNINCDLITVISGTTGFEAALLGKKVIQFSKTFMSVLPNVSVITDLTKFTKELKKIKEFNEDQTIKLISNIYENSFELSYSLAYRKKIDPKPYIDAMMEKIISKKNKEAI